MTGKIKLGPSHDPVMSAPSVILVALAVAFAGCLGTTVEPAPVAPASKPAVPDPETTKKAFTIDASLAAPPVFVSVGFSGPASAPAGPAPRALVVEGTWTCTAPPSCNGFLYAFGPAEELRDQVSGRGGARMVLDLTDDDRGTWRIVPQAGEPVVNLRGTIAVTVFYETPPADFTAL